MGDLMGRLLVERLAPGGLGTGRIAWLKTHRILISLCCSSFLILGGALASVSTGGDMVVFPGVDFYFYFYTAE